MMLQFVLVQENNQELFQKVGCEICNKQNDCVYEDNKKPKQLKISKTLKKTLQNTTWKTGSTVTTTQPMSFEAQINAFTIAG